MSAADLRTWAWALGGDVVADRRGAQILCPGPGHSPRDRSLAVRPSAGTREGFVVFSHAGNDWKLCSDHVKKQLGGLQHQSNPPIRPSPRQSRVLDLWDEARHPRGTIVEQYLAGRSLELTDDIAGSVVRYHPRCPWRDDATQAVIRVPAMLTAFRSIANSRVITAVQRTALTPAGEKIGRKMLGPVAASAIMLDPDEHVTSGLVVGEGFETALAARQLGWRPVWALGSASAIAAFPVLSGIDCLTVLAEHDDGGANARAIDTAGRRWINAGREVLIVSPRMGGDANDALRNVA